MGNTASCCRYDSHNLVTSWSCFIRSNIVWSSSSGITINLRRQWQKVSYMCSWFDTNVCCCFKLHQFLCTLYSNDWNLLQVRLFFVSNFILTSKLSSKKFVYYTKKSQLDIIITVYQGLQTQLNFQWLNIAFDLKNVLPENCFLFYRIGGG